jgi:hypothetical protein
LISVDFNSWSLAVRVETRTGLVYDEDDERCDLTLMSSGAAITEPRILIAIVTALDGRHLKKYWGEYDHDDAAGCIERILMHGGKW